MTISTNAFTNDILNQTSMSFVLADIASRIFIRMAQAEGSFNHSDNTDGMGVAAMMESVLLVLLFCYNNAAMHSETYRCLRTISCSGKSFLCSSIYTFTQSDSCFIYYCLCAPVSPVSPPVEDLRKTLYKMMSDMSSRRPHLCYPRSHCSQTFLDTDSKTFISISSCPPSHPSILQSSNPLTSWSHIH